MKKTIVLSLILAASMGLAACNKAADTAANASENVTTEAVEGAENAAGEAMNAGAEAMNAGADAMNAGGEAMNAGGEAVNAAADATKNAM